MKPLIGFSLFSLNTRQDEISSSISKLSKELGRGVSAFTPQSESKGNLRANLSNPYLEHKKFFDDLLSGSRKTATAINFGKILRHQLQVEFSKREAFSSPSKTSVIKECGQYFYREVFTKLFTPLVRGYKVSEEITRNSIYSFYTYTKWLYAFINQRYLKKERALLYEFLKAALGIMHDFFVQVTNIPTTSILSIREVDKYDSPSRNRLGESGEKNADTNSNRRRLRPATRPSGQQAPSW